MSNHNPAILQLAKDLENEGWNVAADHVNFRNSHEEGIPKIGKSNHMPDLYCIKDGWLRGRSEIIVEVETESSIHIDQDQLESFRKSASQKNNRKFLLYIAKENGNIERKEKVS